MQPITFCARCRGMRVGWNSRYILHLVTCKEWVSHSGKLFILAALVGILAFAFPTPSAIFFSNFTAGQETDNAILAAGDIPLRDAAVDATDAFLQKHGVNGPHR